MPALCVAAMLIAASTSASSPATPSAENLVSQAIGATLNADGARAESLLRSIPSDASDKDVRYRDCALRRLAGASDDASPAGTPALISSALHAYRSYWRSALHDREHLAALEEGLLRRLGPELPAPHPKTFDELETALRKALEPSGYYLLGGRTGPLRELMVWHSQRENTFQVALPDGPQAVKVFFLDNFASLGWSTFFTCGRSGTGGWTTPEALYAVVPNYDSLEDENFKVNFLTHEAQHYQDTSRGLKLEDWVKEYRAKLAELAAAHETLDRVLKRFISEQTDDKRSPHGYASKQLLGVLARALGVSSVEEIQHAVPERVRLAARAALIADTLQRGTVGS